MLIGKLLAFCAGMARAMWSGAISFGMVTIPVQLRAATESKSVHFNQLHAECHSRIQHRLWCPVCERAVERSEVVRGYEYARGQYVVVADEEIEELPVPSRSTIALSAFVDGGKLDPIYHDSTYFVEPREVGLKPYRLLHEALASSGRVGIASVAMRARERLCALRPLAGALVLDTLLYPDEVRLGELPKLPAVELSAKEVGMARDLIAALEAPFDPAAYEDRYREALLELIERKVEGREGVAAPAPAAAAAAEPIDLMAALRASVAAAQKRAGPAEPARRGRKKAA
jgi:DNA end-binding protein Ku